LADLAGIFRRKIHPGIMRNGGELVERLRRSRKSRSAGLRAGTNISISSESGPHFTTAFSKRFNVICIEKARDIYFNSIPRER
jgi:hypothetical protein